MKDITVILPIHKINEDYLFMLENAVKSVEAFHQDVKLDIVCPPDIEKVLTDISNKLEYKIVINEGQTDFCSQVNLGITKCDTKWFSILEIDDEYNKIWLPSMHEYMKEYEDVDVFLPVVKDVNVEGKMLSFTNESVWAYGFTNEQGYLDNDTLLDFQNFQTSGGLFKTEVVKENGMFKDNIKYTFVYEFLLRLTNNDVKIMTVPKVGYQHVNFREDSYYDSFKEGKEGHIDEDEIKFWIETAKKEFFFKNKREVNYSVD